MTVSRARLRWRCRRGLKELDVFFEAFVAQALDNLDEESLPALERILQMQDQDILAGLLGDDALIRTHAGHGAIGVAQAIRACLPHAGNRS